MPVTAKFSEEFYKALGHKQVDELVNWCNQLDTTYRSEFRDLFDLNFSRFDAKLEQRLAEAKAELRAEMADLKADLKNEVRKEIAGLRDDFGKLRVDVAAAGSKLTMRMFFFWIATVGILVLQKL